MMYSALDFERPTTTLLVDILETGWINSVKVIVNTKKEVLTIPCIFIERFKPEKVYYSRFACLYTLSDENFSEGSYYFIYSVYENSKDVQYTTPEVKFKFDYEEELKEWKNSNE